MTDLRAVDPLNDLEPDTLRRAALVAAGQVAESVPPGEEVEALAELLDALGICARPSECG